MYQLCLGEENLSTLLDRIADRACAVAPGLEPESCRHLIDLVFRARVRKTEACGRYPECRPGGAVWGQHQPRGGETAGWEDLDPRGLPEMFAVAAADLANTPPFARHVIEERLAKVFRAAVGELLFCNPSCGQAEVCRAEPIFPLRDRR